MKLAKFIFTILLLSSNKVVFVKENEIKKDAMQLQNVKNETVKSGEIYEHYKGKRYKIHNLAFYSEDPETVMVIYEALYDDPKFGNHPIWARPLKMFVENVEINGKIQPRFKKIS